MNTLTRAMTEFVNEEGGDGSIEHGATILLWAAAFGAVFMCFHSSIGTIVNTIAGHFSKHLNDIATTTVKQGM